MTTLNVEISAQSIWSGGDLYGLVQGNAPDISNFIPIQIYFQVGTPQDPSASPFPIFPDTPSAISYLQTTLAGMVLSSANTMAESSYYSDTFIETVDTPTEYLYTTLYNMIPTEVSELTNDSNYVSATALASSLSNYVTTSSLSSTLSAYVTSASLGSTLSSYITASALASTLSSYVTNSSLSSTLSGYATSSALTSGLSGKFNSPSGTTSQYIRGDGTLATFPTPAVRVFSTPTFSSATTATQLSSTRDAQVTYDIDATVSISLLVGQSITAILTYADNSAMTTNAVIVSSKTTANSGVLGLTQTNTLNVAGIIPAGKYRQVTFTTSGSPTTPTVLKSGQEVLM